MRVTAKRLGWDERLSEEQAMDADPYDHDDDDLEGELSEHEIPASQYHGPIHVCLVGGHEADPKTVKPMKEDDDDEDQGAGE